jgi:hypothetical protein
MPSYALRCDPPDLLIADIRLGEFNGVHLLIIAENRFPVIVSSGFQDSVLERPCTARRGLHIETARCAITGGVDSTPPRWFLSEELSQSKSRMGDVP